MKTLSSAPSHRQSGFSLLEVLITVLVFSIGLLGLAGLQIIALKSNQNAMSRSIASEAAYDMIDLLRAQYKTSNGLTNCASTTIQGYSDLKTYIEGALPGAGMTCAITTGDKLSKKTATVVVTWKQASVAVDSGAEFGQALTADNVEKVTVVGQL